MFNLYKFGADCTQVDLGRYSFYVSFKTPIAFRAAGDKAITVSENVWGEKTARHIEQFTLGRAHDLLPRSVFSERLKSTYRRAILDAAETVRLECLNLQENKHDLSPKRDAGQACDCPDGIVA